MRPAIRTILRISILSLVLSSIALYSLTPRLYAIGQSPTATYTPTPATVATVTVPASSATATAKVGDLVAQEFTLTSLGVRPIELVSPQGSTQFTFRIPDNWQPDGTSTLNLSLDYFQNGTGSTSGTPSSLVTTVQVRLDNLLAGTISFSGSAQSSQVVQIPLSLASLSNQTQRTHTIQLLMDARDQCLSNVEVHVLTRTNQSYFHFEYRQLPPVLDLSAYPRPLYNTPLQGQPETVLLVLPANYTGADLEAAASLSAGLGDLTGNTIQVRVTSADKITDAERKSYNLLLLGQIGTNKLIDQLYTAKQLPTQLGTDGTLTVQGTSVAGTDGVIQVIANPDNPLQSIVVVSGQTPEALQKAARALAGPPSVMRLGGNLALVADVRAPGQAATATVGASLQSFASHSFPDTTIGGVGTRSTEVRFTVPPGTQLTADAYIDLHFDYSDLLRQSQTTLALLMNDTPIGSAQLGNPTGAPAAPIKHLKVSIPPGTVHAGETNILTIGTDVQGDWKCYPPSARAAWLTVYSDSLFNLPQQPVDQASLNPLVNWFPSPFIASPDMNDLWLALPDQPTMQDLEQAMALLGRLGANTISGQRFAPHVSLGKMPSGIDLANYNLIVVGRPTTNTFLASLNEKLPQPFAANSDDLKQVLDNVTYRTPASYDVGVLETLKSPWSRSRAILVITGTSAGGQASALNVLLSQIYQREDLAGDVVFTTNNKISTVNSRDSQNQDELQTSIPSLMTQSAATGLPSATVPAAFTVTPGPTVVVPTRTPTAVTSPTPLFTVEPSITPLPTFAPLAPGDIKPVLVERPIWLTFLIGLTGVILVIVLIWGLFSLLRRQRKERD